MRSAPTVSGTRIILLGAVAFLWLGLILVRLIDLQVLRHPELARRARRQQQRTFEITPKRGILYDRNRRELAVSIRVESLFAVPPEVTDPALAARLLAPVLELEPTTLEDRLRSARSFVWVKRKLGAAQTERVRSLNLAGLHFQSEYKRFYPKRELAAHVLGFVGIDENGLAGIEYALDDVIRGRPRRLVITADGRRRWVERHSQVREEGASVVLTLDEKIQYIAEQELAAAIARTGAHAGTVLVQDPGTGEILAMANYPSFNPNNPTAVPTARHVNRALSLVYEPGSTFKIVTTAAGLEEGVTWPGELIDCQQGSIVLAGHRIRDHKPFGRLSLRQVIQESSDVGIIKIALRLGQEKLYHYIHRWGFARPTGIELPAESRGLLRPVHHWSRVSIGAIAMGQEVAITPLQLITAISALANGGVWLQPRVVREMIGESGDQSLTPPRRERIIPAGVAEELRRMLVGVVRRGTGRLAQPVGYSAAGKTGTAQKMDATGAYSRTDFIASFAGFAPAPAPAISVVVVLDSPQGKRHDGGEVAAPVFQAVVERSLAYLNVPRDLPVEPQRAAPRLARAAAQDFPSGQVEPALSLAEPPPLRTVSLRRQGVPRSRSTVVLLTADTAVVPDFSGLSLRAVGEKCARLGLEVVVSGSGVAVAQRPGAGTRVPRGSRVAVKFRPASPSAPARSM